MKNIRNNFDLGKKIGETVELLPMGDVMNYLIENDQPLIDDSSLERLMICSEKEWERYIGQFRGQLVTNPGKKPSTIRLDQLDREQTFTGQTNQA